jgi:hypothetical protein
VEKKKLSAHMELLKVSQSRYAGVLKQLATIFTLLKVLTFSQYSLLSMFKGPASIAHETKPTFSRSGSMLKSRNWA